MSEPRLALLWHLHQPDYRHPVSGEPVMPWVRMHALRGYRDLVVESLEDEVPVTLNWVPSLLDQLLAYAQGGADRHLVLTERPADALSAQELGEVHGTFLGGHPAMRTAHPHYAHLAARVAANEQLDTPSIRDLQIWSTLAWFGATAMRDHPEIGVLRTKGRRFTEDDKAVMLRVQREILTDLPSRLRAFATQGPGAVSTTPYYHPILPLLVDTEHARRCLPHLPRDIPRFAWPDDARLQLVRARARVKELMGVLPLGVWPSEGSVSPEVAALIAEVGFTWLATDDGVLFRSEGEPSKRPGPWAIDGGPVGFFRDHDLSDRVGFDYASRDPIEAVADLVGTAAERAKGGVVTVALDGENPWESWTDAGQVFRRHLHAALRQGPIRGITLDEAAQRPPVGRITTLHTGSWIGADLAIWFGHADDHAAWRLLAEARAAADEATPERRTAAIERLLPAQGSDWMWWYGAEFQTPFASLFDALFRAHVQAAWDALGLPAPAAIHEPIGAPVPPHIRVPRGWITPRVSPDPSWIEWANAGRVRWPPGGAMARGAVHSPGFAYGWSPADKQCPAGCLWIRVDLAAPVPAEPDATWRVVAGDQSAEAPYGADAFRTEGRGVAIAAGSRALTVRFDARNLPKGEVPVHLEVSGARVTRYPASDSVRVPVPVRPVPLTWWLV